MQVQMNHLDINMNRQIYISSYFGNVNATKPLENVRLNLKDTQTCKQLKKASKDRIQHI